MSTKTEPKKLYDFYVEGRLNGIKRWEGIPDDERRYSLAKASYMRMKRKDVSKAIAWLEAKFGAERAKALISSWNFQ